MVGQSKVLVIDGNNLLHRVYWTATTLENSDSFTHIFIFLNTLKSYVELFDPRKIIVCWDFRDKSVDNYRKVIEEGYKAQRDEEKANKVYEKISIIIKLLDSLGITQINPKELEADDIMFWLATKIYPNETIIVSTDTDMYQLISDFLPGNVVYNPKKKVQVTKFYLKEHFNVENGTDFILQKALRGDKADNLPGIRGIRSTRVQDILSILAINFDLNALKDSSLLKEEELETFKHNLALMQLTDDIVSDEEEAWWTECLNRETTASKELFMVLIKQLEFWKIYKKIDYWFKTLNRFYIGDVLSSLFFGSNQE